MSLVATSPLRARTYTRLFDHEEAARRRCEGESVADLAADYGVSPSAIYQATANLDPAVKARSVAANKAWRTGVCEDCDGPAMRLVSSKREHNPDGRVLCHDCRSIERSERLRWNDRGDLMAVRCSSRDCANGERWQPPENFSRGSSNRAAREGGIHNWCRACGTRARQEYRERHKLPCTYCGAPCLPAGEKGQRGGDSGLCGPCWRKSPEAQAALATARETSAAVRRKAR